MQNYPLSKQLYEETKSAHAQVESMDFVIALRDQKLAQADYVQYLTDLKQVYRALEDGLRTNLDHAAIKTLYDEKLCRSETLAVDLKSFEADDTQPTEAGQGYAQHLSYLAKHHPVLLLAHAYVRYLGDLSGGRMMKKFVELLFPGEHTAFYNFDALLGSRATGAKLVEYKNHWKERLDNLPFTDAEKKALIVEAKKAFDYAGSMIGSYKFTKEGPEFKITTKKEQSGKNVI